MGPKLGSIFASRGIETVRDLLTFFPRAYEDRSKVSKISELQDGQSATVSAQVLTSRRIPVRTRFKSLLEVRCSDESGSLSLKWFHAPPQMEKRFIPGTKITATGNVRIYMSRPEIIHPEISFRDSLSLDTEEPGYNSGRIVPVYTEIEGVSTRILRRVLWEALQRYSTLIEEDLPLRFLERHKFPKLSESIRFIHFPASDSPEAMQALAKFRSPAHLRLIYEEFFKFEFLVLKQRMNAGRLAGREIAGKASLKHFQKLEGRLPFKLTGDQKKAVQEILKDIAQPHPMNRLVQGDVGSGKTAVTLIIASCVIDAGLQAVLMAPTEILSEQHERSAKLLLGDHAPVRLLTGKTPQDVRKDLFNELESGKPLLLIGTHALLEDTVKPKNLALICIDEQQRFGVEQRMTLRKKGIVETPDPKNRIYPHTLVLTATPIPRTLALTAYGDLEVSLIKEMPPGRTPIVTQIVRDNERHRAYQQIRKEIAEGRQAYFIYPLVKESEAEGFTELKAATLEAERLQNEIYPEFKVGILHGQMKSDEKNAIMAAFKQNKIQILVSTTVVEVGVDVPNATVMVIEHSERFGLSQLHQLRGRVGRGKHASKCYLFCSHVAATDPTSTSYARLDVLEKTQDGFEIAEADLEIRGPGEFLGTRQAGSLPFRLANLVRDREWLHFAREDAQALLNTDPELNLESHLPLRGYYIREGSLQSDRLKTS